MFGEIDWGQVALKGVVGGVIGGVVAVVVVVFKKLSGKKEVTGKPKPGPDGGDSTG
jgi:hypothetical protein